MRIAELLCSLALGISAAGQAAPPSETEAIGRVLDDWHAAAAAADEARYFGHFAPEAVFLGTDGTERWTVEQFRAYAHPYFAKGQGWTYRPSERHVSIARAGALAWFDEQLSSEKYGALRGTGVLLRIGGAWKLVQYSMTFVVPNAATKDVVERIRAPAAAP